MSKPRTKHAVDAPEIPTVRCAIYTRKSTDENLELDFNSLDAQRDSAEAYIASQKGQGWTYLPDRFDDGGFSGGTVDRPAFQRLMADVEAGRVDCIVVYKIDRLSRSLMDFARIMQTLETHHVSLVSVTQQFNTTSSMGRLTLNILLSFAQFEREIISERTRDKIAAARRKGKWTGGSPVLGYDRVRDSRGTRLVVNVEEAKRVRAAFTKYMELQSLLDTVHWLDGRGWRNKQYVTNKGVPRGGKEFDKSTLLKLLTNRLYLGQITYNGQCFDGEHEAIVDEDLFGRVQGQLARNRNSGGGGKYQRNKYGALLKGLVRCKHCGGGMSHHYASRGQRRYRYYVCQTAQKKGWSACPYPSLPAGELEQFVVQRIKEMTGDRALLGDVVSRAREQLNRQTEELEQRRKLHENRARRINADINDLTRSPGSAAMHATSHAASELARLQDELVEVEKEIGDLNRQIVDIQHRMIDEDELTGALEAFDPMWDRLRPTERARVIHLLVQCIEYDGTNEEIAITYHPAGLQAFAEMEPCHA
ncbi:MAG: recombinase family protein [Phycisphaeraceae bacterium]